MSLQAIMGFSDLAKIERPLRIFYHAFDDHVMVKDQPRCSIWTDDFYRRGDTRCK